ncbi:unnamed protein product [Ectocarpus sp. CCAP 1310/34]|nr:unnamed protein product [Ectocarpus sp. CCAP 1310/34]
MCSLRDVDFKPQEQIIQKRFSRPPGRRGGQVAAGTVIILLIQVVLTLTAVDDWGGDTREAMVEVEEANLLKLAEAKAEFVSEQFGRVEESILQLQTFAGQAVLAVPETMTVDSYMTSYSGLLQSDTTFDNSVWQPGYIPDLPTGEVPEAGGSLESLLNRSSLMDVPFRGMQRQHPLVYLAALDDPSPADGTISDINFQAYAGFDMTPYLQWGLVGVCDSWDETTYTGDSYEPRCRLWYQNAIENGNTGVIFTNPYEAASSQELTLTAAAPVFNLAGTVAGVVGLDINTTNIESSIKDLKVIDDDGYAYLLAPGGDGQVAVHRDLLGYGGVTYILDLEFGDDADESGEEESQFLDLVTEISATCSGSAEYSRDGSTWILAWKHETVSGAGASTASDDCGDGGFIAVVTVSESVLLETFSETKSQISRVVLFASLIMALVLVAIVCIMVVTARFVARGIVGPINQLIGAVYALNRLDFSRQPPGTRIVHDMPSNDMLSPEVDDLVEAFESMNTAVKFANTTLATGNMAAAKSIYLDALKLFIKLENERGIGIVRNNLGNICAMEAGELVAQARDARNPAQAKALMEAALLSFTDAAINFKLAIDDAEMLCAATNHQPNGVLPQHPSAHHGGRDGVGETKFEEDVEAAHAALADVDANDDDDDNTSHAALDRQLASRKSNLARCTEARGNSAVATGGKPDLEVINEARNLLQECIQLTSADLNSGGNRSTGDTKNDLQRFGYLLQLSVLERGQGRFQQAGEALDAAELVIAPYERHSVDAGPGATTATPLETPVHILRQRLLEARAALSVANGYHEEAIDHYTQALIGTGDIIDPSVATASLLGLRGLASVGNYGRLFSSELLVALSLHPGAGKDPECLTSAIDHGLDRVKRVKTRMAAARNDSTRKTDVDLCFVMDCTGSMQRWIDQARTRLLDIIDQAKKDVANINLRVAFVGYRDFGDKVQYETFDFHKEHDLPKLRAKLNKIKAYGGADFPEDVAGGLKLATELDWRGTIRLCILLADAPCHGSMYHIGIGDRYPNGCPKGNDPSKLLYELQYEIGADFYFIRMTRHTDKMIRVLQNRAGAMWDSNGRPRPSSRQGASVAATRYIVVHDLGSEDNRFLEVVVESVNVSVMNYRVEH